MPSPTVIQIDDAPVPAEILVAVSPEILVMLAEKESAPLAIIGIQPHASIEGAFELLLRTPSRQELQASIMQRFQTERGSGPRG